MCMRIYTTHTHTNTQLADGDLWAGRGCKTSLFPFVHLHGTLLSASIRWRLFIKVWPTPAVGNLELCSVPGGRFSRSLSGSSSGGWSALQGCRGCSLTCTATRRSWLFWLILFVSPGRPAAAESSLGPSTLCTKPLTLTLYFCNVPVSPLKVIEDMQGPGLFWRSCSAKLRYLVVRWSNK